MPYCKLSINVSIYQVIIGREGGVLGSWGERAVWDADLGVSALEEAELAQGEWAKWKGKEGDSADPAEFTEMKRTKLDFKGWLGGRRGILVSSSTYQYQNPEKLKRQIPPKGKSHSSQEEWHCGGLLWVARGCEKNTITWQFLTYFRPD